MANQEDERTGRFCEGCFKCQPLRDEAATLACAAYVDPNPVRAGIAETPEKNDFTSVQDRIVVVKEKAVPKRAKQDAWLAPLPLNERGSPKPKASRSG